METTTTDFKTFYSFVKDNGYLIAEYRIPKHDKDHYYLKTLDVIYDSNFEVLTRATICGIDFKICKTKDDKSIFIMHNTYDLPEKYKVKDIMF